MYLYLVIGMGNPGVSQGYPYPYLEIPYPSQWVRVLTGQGKGWQGFMGIETLNGFQYPQQVG